MRGIVNYNKTNNLNRWEILFFLNNKIFNCPITKNQLSILEPRDNGEEIEFELEKIDDKFYAVIYSFKSEDKIKYWYNYTKGNLAICQESLVTLYNINGLHDTMHIDYFINEHSNYNKISLKQFLFIYDCLNREPLNLLSIITTFNDLNYYAPKYNLYSEKYKIEIDP